MYPINLKGSNALGHKHISVTTLNQIKTGLDNLIWPTKALFSVHLLLLRFMTDTHRTALHTKDRVSPYHSGCTAVSIHRHDPTTVRHGGFDLLRLRPGPVLPSLDDLVVPSSPRSTISIPNLLRTPDRHSPLQPRTPELKRSASLSLPAAWITGARHRTRRELRESALLLNLMCTQRPLVYES